MESKKIIHPIIAVALIAGMVLLTFGMLVAIGASVILFDKYFLEDEDSFLWRSFMDGLTVFWLCYTGNIIYKRWLK